MARKRKFKTFKYKYQNFLDELRTGLLYGVFIDDTGSPGLATTPQHLHSERKSWIGVVVPPSQMPEVLDQFPAALQELQDHTGAKEFHFTDIYMGRKDFKKFDLGIRLSLFRFMAYIFAVYKFPVFVQTFNPVTLEDIRTRGKFPEKIGPFNLKKQQDMALFFLLIRIKWFLEKSKGLNKAKARIFVDEGYKNNGAAIKIQPFEAVFADGLVCFARSDIIQPIQLADFAAFCLNRSQLLLGKEELSKLDKELLQIISPIAWNYQNIPCVYLSDWYPGKDKTIH